MVESAARVIQGNVDFIHSLVTDGVIESSPSQSVYTLKATLFQIGDVCDMLEKCALSTKKYAQSKRDQVLEDRERAIFTDI
jgi:hypothetical protein